MQEILGRAGCFIAIIILGYVLRQKNFFKEGLYDTYTFIHSKQYNLEMLIGLSKSLSYAPKEDEIYYDYVSVNSYAKLSDYVFLR